MQISTDHIRYLQLIILIIYIIKTLSIRYRRREHATESLLTIKQFRLPIEISKSTLIYLNKTKSLLTRAGNGTRWDGIYQSQSYPIYANEIKKNVSFSFLCFFWDKNISRSRPKRDGILRDFISIRKILILSLQ